ncbi:TMEM175 family protein [Fodinicola acaciae]|uniref:TMEM175 family protein n=1 Tax=Fodinicola acaciae TaxID=2681555 RepID=UPI0013D54780|nr:TMEM175 family protein [Fodinicola acaciae]
MATEELRSPQRLVFFTDAVVAIALTLLVLPVADIVSDARKTGPMPPVWDLIVEHRAVIGAFVVSFLVIVRLWREHHRVFEQVKAYDKRLMTVNMAWLLTVVILPFLTELAANYRLDDRLVLVMYVGALSISSLLLTALLWIVRDDPEVRRAPAAVSDSWRIDSISTTAAFVVALVLVAVFPVLSYSPLLLQLVVPYAVRLRHRRP